jgi:glycosyltransferase involved in cell wall biosynthesis
MSAINQEKTLLSCRNVLVSLPVLHVGGTEIQTLNLTRVLVSAGYRVTLCCYYEYDETMVSEFHFAGVKVILMSLKRSDGILHLMQKMKKIFKTVSPDIVHVQYIAPGLIPILAAKLSGISTVFATVHQPGTPYGLKAKLFLRIGSSLCKAFFCVSKSAEESWFGDSEILNPQNVNRKRKHFTIYNAVDVSAIAHAVGSVNLDHLRINLGLDSCPVVGIVGRLRKEKGHSILLDAMVEVVRDVPSAKLLVVGDGPDRSQLIRRAETLDIADHILWLGAKEPAETIQLYGIMDVVVVPSLFEGFGLTAAEAMAAGRPVVASEVDGLREVIHQGRTGFLIPPGNSNIMAKRLVELLSDPTKAQAMGEAGRQRVKQHFSLERFAEAALTAYQYFS